MRSSLADKISRSRRLRYQASIQGGTDGGGSGSGGASVGSNQDGQQQPPPPPPSSQSKESSSTSPIPTFLSKSERRKAMAKAHMRQTLTTSASSVSSTSDTEKKEDSTKTDQPRTQASVDSQQHPKSLAEKRRKALQSRTRAVGGSVTAATVKPVVESYGHESQISLATPSAETVLPATPARPSFSSKYYSGAATARPSASNGSDSPTPETQALLTTATNSSSDKSKTAITAARPRLRLDGETTPGRELSQSHSNSSGGSSQVGSNASLEDESSKKQSTSQRFQRLHRARAASAATSRSPPPEGNNKEEDEEREPAPVQSPPPPAAAEGPWGRQLEQQENEDKQVVEETLNPSTLRLRPGFYPQRNHKNKSEGQPSDAMSEVTVSDVIFQQEDPEISAIYKITNDEGDDNGEVEEKKEQEEEHRQQARLSVSQVKNRYIGSASPLPPPMGRQSPASLRSSSPVLSSARQQFKQNHSPVPSHRLPLPYQPPTPVQQQQHSQQQREPLRSVPASPRQQWPPASEQPEQREPLRSVAAPPIPVQQQPAKASQWPPSAQQQQQQSQQQREPLRSVPASPRQQWPPAQQQLDQRESLRSVPASPMRQSSGKWPPAQQSQKTGELQGQMTPQPPASPKSSVASSSFLTERLSPPYGGGGMMARAGSPTPSNASSSVMGRQTPLVRGTSSKAVVVPAPASGPPDLGLPSGEPSEPRLSVLGSHQKRLLEQYNSTTRQSEPIRPTPHSAQQPQHHMVSPKSAEDAAEDTENAQLLGIRAQHQQPRSPSVHWQDDIEQEPGDDSPTVLWPEDQVEKEEPAVSPRSLSFKQTSPSRQIREKEKTDQVQQQPRPSWAKSQSYRGEQEMEGALWAKSHANRGQPPPPRPNDQTPATPNSFSKTTPRNNWGKSQSYRDTPHKVEDQPRSGLGKSQSSYPVSLSQPHHPEQKPSPSWANNNNDDRLKQLIAGADGQEHEKAVVPASSYQSEPRQFEQQTPPRPSVGATQTTASYGGGRVIIETPEVASVSKFKAQFEKPRNSQSAPPQRATSISGTPAHHQAAPVEQEQSHDRAYRAPNVRNEPQSSGTRKWRHSLEPIEPTDSNHPDPDPSLAELEQASVVASEASETGHAAPGRPSVMSYWKTRIDGPSVNTDAHQETDPNQAGKRWTPRKIPSAPSDKSWQKPSEQDTMAGPSPSHIHREAAPLSGDYHSDEALKTNWKTRIDGPSQNSDGQQEAEPNQSAKRWTHRQLPSSPNDKSWHKSSEQQTMFGPSTNLREATLSSDDNLEEASKISRKTGINTDEQQESDQNQSARRWTPRQLSSTSNPRSWQKNSEQQTIPSPSPSHRAVTLPPGDHPLENTVGTNVPVEGNDRAVIEVPGKMSVAKMAGKFQQGASPIRTESPRPQPRGRSLPPSPRIPPGETHSNIGTPNSARISAGDSSPAQYHWRGASPARNPSTGAPMTPVGQPRAYSVSPRTQDSEGWGSPSPQHGRRSWIKPGDIETQGESGSSELKPEGASRSLSTFHAQQDGSSFGNNSPRNKETRKPSSGHPSSTKTVDEIEENVESPRKSDTLQQPLWQNQGLGNAEQVNQHQLEEAKPHRLSPSHGMPKHPFFQQAREAAYADTKGADHDLRRSCGPDINPDPTDHDLSVMGEQEGGYPSRDSDIVDDSEPLSQPNPFPSQAERLAAKVTKESQNHHSQSRNVGDGAGASRSRDMNHHPESRNVGNGAGASRSRGYVSAPPTLPPHARSKDAFEELQKKLLKRQYDVEVTSAASTPNIQNLSATTVARATASALDGLGRVDEDEDGMLQTSPRTLGELAAQSIHAIGYDEGLYRLADLATAGSCSGDEDESSTREVSSAVPNYPTLPPEFHSTASPSPAHHHHSVPPVRKESAGDTQSDVVFGDPDTYGAAGGEADRASPRVADRAKAIAEWKGGTNSRSRASDGSERLHPHVQINKLDGPAETPRQPVRQESPASGAETVDEAGQTRPMFSSRVDPAVMKLWRKPTAAELDAAENFRDDDPAVTDYVSDVQTDVPSEAANAGPTGRLISPSLVRDRRHKNRSDAPVTLSPKVMHELQAGKPTHDIFRVAVDEESTQQTAKVPDPFSPSAINGFQTAPENRRPGKGTFDSFWDEGSCKNESSKSDGFCSVDGFPQTGGFEKEGDFGFGSASGFTTSDNGFAVGIHSNKDDGFGIGQGFASAGDDDGFGAAPGYRSDPQNDGFGMHGYVFDMSGPQGFVRQDDGFGIPQGFGNDAHAANDGGFGSCQDFDVNCFPSFPAGKLTASNADDGFGFAPHTTFNFGQVSGTGDDGFGSVGGFGSNFGQEKQGPPYSGSNGRKIRPLSRASEDDDAANPLPLTNRKSSSCSAQPRFTSFDKFYEDDEYAGRGNSSHQQNGTWSFGTGIGNYFDQQRQEPT